jgi:hypothetical protein
MSASSVNCQMWHKAAVMGTPGFLPGARAISFALALALLHVSVATSKADDESGHSSHGSAFDSGLRQRPWKMEGIGHTHFPITTKVPEVQEWFDQGNTLMHSFWFEEAERSFRWCLKLDPDCAMAYWGLARTGLTWFTRGSLDTPETKRYLDFLNEAVRRKDAVTPRERMYIEAWATAFSGETSGKERMHALAKELQKIVLKFPDDIEAKALFALYSITAENALGNELVIRQVLEKEPDHPGAHHYRIHNWDHVDPEQALPSCQQYGVVAPNIGHADHMPGHNYTKMGLWHEAAWSMDTATRVELRYMNERMALPFETWNYAHNRNYLCYIQEQLGMPEASLQGARDLLAAPRDPERNKDINYGAFGQGMIALVRALVKFERWDDVLAASNSVAIPWRDIPSDKGPSRLRRNPGLYRQRQSGQCPQPPAGPQKRPPRTRREIESLGRGPGPFRQRRGRTIAGCRRRHPRSHPLFDRGGRLGENRAR